MKTRILLLIVLNVFIAHSVICQGIEQIILNKKSTSCEEVSQSTSEVFAEYIQQGDIDSAKLILNYWEEKCEFSEPVIRARILIDLMESEDLDYLINKDFMWYLYNFQTRQDYGPQGFPYYDVGPYFGFVQPHSLFDKVLTKAFTELLAENNMDKQSTLISKFYTGQFDSVFHELQKDQLLDMPIHDVYHAEVKQVRKMTEGHFGWITGAWVPTGELKTLGVHPDLGFLAGWKIDRWNYDFIMAFKFLKAKNEYLATRKSSNTPESTNHFFGGQIGFEVGRDIFNKRNHEFQLLSGIAMDGIDVLQEDVDSDLDARSIVSYNLNIGVGYRFYTNGNFYLGVRAKYNVIDYTINNAIDLTGNAFTVHFVVGNVNNIYKSGLLKQLGQRMRQ